MVGEIYRTKQTVVLVDSAVSHLCKLVMIFSVGETSKKMQFFYVVRFLSFYFDQDKSGAPDPGLTLQVALGGRRRVELEEGGWQK